MPIDTVAELRRLYQTKKTAQLPKPFIGPVRPKELGGTEFEQQVYEARGYKPIIEKPTSLTPTEKFLASPGMKLIGSLLEFSLSRMATKARAPAVGEEPPTLPKGVEVKYQEVTTPIGERKIVPAPPRLILSKPRAQFTYQERQAIDLTQEEINSQVRGYVNESVNWLMVTTGARLSPATLKGVLSKLPTIIPKKVASTAIVSTTAGIENAIWAAWDVAYNEKRVITTKELASMFALGSTFGAVGHNVVEPILGKLKTGRFTKATTPQEQLGQQMVAEMGARKVLDLPLDEVPTTKSINEAYRKTPRVTLEQKLTVKSAKDVLTVKAEQQAKLKAEYEAVVKAETPKPVEVLKVKPKKAVIAPVEKPIAKDILYHGSFTPLEKIDTTRPLSLTLTPEFAKTYGKNVVPIRIKPGAKILDLDLTSERVANLADFAGYSGKKIDLLTKLYPRYEHMLKSEGDMSGLLKNIGTYDPIVKYAKDNGYDAIKLRSTNSGGTHIDTEIMAVNLQKFEIIKPVSKALEPLAQEARIEQLHQEIRKLQTYPSGEARIKITSSTRLAIGKRQQELYALMAKQVPKELQPLAVEARKYKSAEEFVNKKTITGKQIIDEYKSNGDRVNYDVEQITKNNNFVKETVDPNTIKSTLTKERIIQSGGQDLADYKRIVKGLKEGKKLPTVVLNKMGEPLDGYKRVVAAKELGLKVDVYKPVTKSQLTDFYNQAVKGVKEIKPIIPLKAVKIKEMVTTPVSRKVAVVKPVITEGIKKTPKLMRRLEGKLTELDTDFKYNQLDIKKDAAKAVDFVNQYPDRAKKISYGRENPPEGISGSAIREAYRLSVENNPIEYTKVAHSEALREVRLGQEIAVLKEWRNIADPIIYVKQIIAQRLKDISKTNIVYGIEKAVKHSQKAGELIIRKEVDQVKKVIDFTQLKIKSAQSILDAITCK